MMTFDALYETEHPTDAGARVVVATDLQDAKRVLRAQIEAEGAHGAYRLDMLLEIKASFNARQAAH